MRRSTIAVLALPILASLSAGCGTTTSSDAPIGPAASATSSTDRSDGTPASRQVRLATGTVVQIEFDDSVSTESSAPGDDFLARVIDPVIADDRVVIDRGATVHGRVLGVQSGKKIGGKAKLNLEFTTVELASGEQAPIDATFYSEGKSQAGKDAATIGGSTAGGAILGRILGHQQGEDARGTAIGAVVGAAIGTAIAASNEGEPVVIPAGTRVAIRLDAPLTVTI